MLIKKPNRKWRTCIDFIDLNKAYLKDGFPLPCIDQLVYATSWHTLLTFIDAYFGYNQIPMYALGEEYSSFITNRGLYYYKVMFFGLKNVGATYQKFINMMFADQISKTMELYVDDILIKIKLASEHIANLTTTFEILQ